MEIKILPIPNLIQNNQTILPIDLGEYDALIVFKQQFRSDDVLVNIYKNEISPYALIKGDILLTANGTVTNTNPQKEFNWNVFCANIDGTNEEINFTNAHKFYLQLEKVEDE